MNNPIVENAYFNTYGNGQGIIATARDLKEVMHLIHPHHQGWVMTALDRMRSGIEVMFYYERKTKTICISL